MKSFFGLTRKHLAILLVSCLYYPVMIHAEVSTGVKSTATQKAPDDFLGVEAPIDNSKSINVTDKVGDNAIQARIQNILVTSDWFLDVSVTSVEGIVVLSGSTAVQEYRDWAGSIATRTEGVVAVINKIGVDTGDDNSLSPVVKESQLLWRKTVNALPFVGISVVVLLFFFMLSRYVARLSLRVTRAKIPSLMLRRLIANVIAAPIILIGIYLVLRVTGLGQVAATIVGGTGLIGLVLGFAFRDIVENFLASILISIQRPFRLGETIQVLNYTGVVQAVTTRGTVLMTLEGNHVQIPNSTIYKEAIVNFSANPNIRLDFMVGIGYDASISDAQTIALQVLVDHPAVLATPEPWVLAEALSASTVNLRIYFWVNNSSHNPLKVKSAIIRNVKYAFLNNNISMPDDAREVIFPEGVRVFSEQSSLPDAKTNKLIPAAPVKPAVNKVGDDKESTKAEGNLDSDIPVIKSQANQYSLDNGDTNLLVDNDSQ